MKNNFVENPWQINSDSIYYIDLLAFYAKKSISDVKFIENIVKGNFVNVLIEFYYKLDEENKLKMMKIFADLSSNDDSINQIFINEGILGLLINEINRIEYKNNKFLSIIFHVCSNIACGTLGQVDQLNGQGLLWKAIDIAYHYINQNIFNYDKNQVIYNALYTITQAILGADNEIKTQLIIYQKYLIVSLYHLGLKKYYENKNELSFLTQMGNAIYQLINCGEADLDVEVLNKLRNQFIYVGMEELIINILNKYIDCKIQYSFCLILNFIQEEDI